MTGRLGALRGADGPERRVGPVVFCGGESLLLLVGGGLGWRQVDSDKSDGPEGWVGPVVFCDGEFLLGSLGCDLVALGGGEERHVDVLWGACEVGCVISVFCDGV